MNLFRKQAGTSTFKRKKIKILAITMVFIVFIFAFSYVPLLGWIIAFLDYKPGISMFSQKFVGLDNFKLIFSSWRDFKTILLNTLALSGINLLAMPVPLIFAILLSQMRSKRLSKMVQIVSSLPNYISYVLLYTVFFCLLAPSDGAVNVILRQFFGPEFTSNLLADKNIAWTMQLFIGLFKTMGYSAIMYIAAMSGIDQELYDAADVDGAGRFAKVIHITLPGISSTFFVLFLLAIANMLSGAGFEQYYVFQNPMVMSKIEVLDTYIYKIGLQQNNFGFATSTGMLKSLLSIGLLMGANKLSKIIRGESIF